ncbi:lipopolysaccharide biosynthesis protein [Stappia indica]|uniref:lipopolysaccharide biosynthesis protein n=1 Tax=Stappia indica TaxID=538381 RepID=UPI001CD21155|nr:lipopolysaccharide biosynthesis protein [Stappia indica]MCA1299383.1 lipopolysaccharide biosynthesis protein [Stappia indica]
MSDKADASLPVANATAESLPQKPKKAPVIPLRIERAAAALVKTTETGLRPREVRRLLLKLSFVLCVILPTLFGGIYFAFIASDRYAASAGFSVRSMDSSAVGGDVLGALTGLSSVGSTTTDSYILLEYLKSRELLEALRKDVDFQAAYGSDRIDFLYRLDPTLPIEDLVDYWDWMITTSYDNASSIMTFEVQAFTPEDAQKIAALIVKHSQNLINKLSEQARKDAVQFAKREVASAELRLKILRDEMQRFRSSSHAVDPTATAAAQVELVTGIERQLIELRARMISLRTSLDETSPSVQQLSRQIAALENQLQRKQQEVGGAPADANTSNPNLSALLADYEKLKVDQEFAQQAYAATLASLERARAEADRQQRFLAVFRAPSLPQDSLYPERILNTVLIFVVALLLWSIGTLIVYSVRDHMR